MQHKREPSYTVLVVPEKGAQVTRLGVTGAHVLLLSRLARYDAQRLRQLAWVGASIAFVLLSAAVAMTWHYFAVVGRAWDNAALREENLELKEQLAGIKEKLAHINETITRVKHLNANLQNISQLNDPERRLAAALDSPPEALEEPSARELSEQLSQMEAEAKSQELSLRALTGYFEDRQALLASAPSIWPVRGWVTSDFGFRLDPYTSERTQHLGLDVANRPGTPVVAPADGVVVYNGRESGYGNVIVIDHGNGIKTRYAHLQESKVRLGERVGRGIVIATLGNSGRSTGPHLHYEVRVNGVPENPRKFILEADDPGDPRRGVLAGGRAPASGGAMDLRGMGGGN